MPTTLDSICRSWVNPTGPVQPTERCEEEDMLAIKRAMDAAWALIPTRTYSGKRTPRHPFAPVDPSPLARAAVRSSKTPGSADQD